MKPDVTVMLDKRLLRAIENRCSHPLRVPTINDARFGEGCSACIELAHDLIKIVDEFGVDNGSSSAGGES